MSSHQGFIALFALTAAGLPFAAEPANAQATSFRSDEFFAMPRGGPGESVEVAFMCLRGYDINLTDRVRGEIPQAISIGIDDDIRGGFSMLTVPTSLIVNGNQRVDGHSYIQLPVIASQSTGGVYLDVTGNGDFQNNVTQGRAVFIEEGVVDDYTRQISPIQGARVENPTLDELYLLAEVLADPMAVQDGRHATRAFRLQPMRACNPPSQVDWIQPRSSGRDQRSDLDFGRYRPDTSFNPGAGLPEPGRFLRPQDLRDFRDQITPPRRHRGERRPG